MYKIIGTTKDDKEKFYLSSMPGLMSGVGFGKEVLRSYSFTSTDVAERFLHLNKKALIGNPEGVKYLYLVDNNGNWKKLGKLGKKKVKVEKRVA